jgi:hypothetical protein
VLVHTAQPLGDEVLVAIERARIRPKQRDIITRRILHILLLSAKGLQVSENKPPEQQHRNDCIALQKAHFPTDFFIHIGNSVSCLKTGISALGVSPDLVKIHLDPVLDAGCIMSSRGDP